MGLHELVQDEARARGIDLRLRYIPREVMDPRAVASGEITFHELAYVKVATKTVRRTVQVTLEAFVLPNPDLVPVGVRDKITGWAEYVDYWAVDFTYGRRRRRGHLPQPVAVLPHPGQQVARAHCGPRVRRAGRPRRARQGGRHLRQRHDHRRTGDRAVTDPYSVPAERRPSNAPLVAGIRTEVDAWRAGGYPGASPTSRRLLEHWFLDEHQITGGEPFRYFFCQREAVESLIYLHEVAASRTLADLVTRYASEPVPVAAQDYPRYVVKMATGSGKTKVMSLAIVWAYYHALR